MLDCRPTRCSMTRFSPRRDGEKTVKVVSRECPTAQDDNSSPEHNAFESGDDELWRHHFTWRHQPTWRHELTWHQVPLQERGLRCLSHILVSVKPGILLYLDPRPPETTRSENNTSDLEEWEYPSPYCEGSCDWSHLSRNKNFNVPGRSSY